MRTVLAASACLVLLAGCSSPKGTYVTPAELAASEAGLRPPGVAAAAASAPAPADAAARAGTTSDEYVERKRGFDGRRRELLRRAEDLDRDRKDHGERTARLEVQHAAARAEEQLALRQVEHAHAVAVEDLERFVAVVRDRRLREDALELQAVADMLLETREELAQLELMYGDDELGDATAEIVLERTRRRLRRAEERHALAQQESTELREVSLPREERELELALEAARVALENAQREGRAGELERSAALRELEGDALALQREEDDIYRETQELDGDLRRWEQSLP
jgi:hypothetical protein